MSEPREQGAIDHQRFARHDAAYVLGALGPGERRDYEEHLRECVICQAEVAEIADTAALLAAPRMRAELGAVFAAPGGAEPDSGLGLPDSVLPGLSRSAARRTRRRQVATAAVAALAAACVVALAVILWPSGSTGSRPSPVAFVAVQPNPVLASAVLVGRPWGTSIELECRYAAGITSSLPYVLRVIDRRQRVHAAGAWTLVPGRTIRFTGGTDVPRGQIAGLQITLTDGTPILQATP